MKKVNSTTATKAIENVIEEARKCRGEYLIISCSMISDYEKGELSSGSLETVLKMVISRAKEAGYYDEKAS